MTAQPPTTRLHLERPSRQWVDLFYDLAIAAAIIDLASAYSKDASPSGAIWLGLAYGVLWCTWLLTSAATGSFMHAQRTLTVPTVVALVLQMGAILFLAVASSDSVADDAGLFDLLVGVALLLSLVLTVVARRHTAHSGAVTGLIVAAVVALAASYVVPGGLGWAVWAAAFVLVGIAVWLVAGSSEFDTHRVLHRLGELTVIVIGETLVKLVLTASEHTVASVSVVALVAILATLAAIWWAYFSGLTHTTALDGPHRRFWIVLHLPLHLALLGISVGLAKLLVGDPSLAKPFGALGLVAAPVVFAVLVEAGLAVTSRRATAAWFLGAGAIVMAALSLLCQLTLPTLPSALLLAAVALVVAGLATTSRRAECEDEA